MFYYPNVLQYRAGCFSTVWLAATKPIKLSRRDYLKVNIQRTCNDIMDYMLVQVPPPQPDLPRPRFSLYLLSQLQYGVITVYHRQCALLLEEIRLTIDRLLRYTKQQKIDLVEPHRLALTVPDGLVMLEESEGALDPFFGVMGYSLPSPTLMQVAEEALFHRPLVETPRAPQEDRITASPEAITLVDREPVVIPVAEFEGEDLQEVTPGHMDIIKLLMEQQDEFPEGPSQRSILLKAAEAKSCLSEVEDREEELTAVSISQLEVTSEPSLETTLVIPPPSSPEGEREGAPEELAVSRRERELERERERQRREERERDAAGLEVCAVGEERRRRQLLFIDEQTQIPSEELQEAIQDPLTETQALVSFEPPSRRRTSAEELLRSPCTGLYPDILDLWKRAAVICPLPDVAEGEPSDREVPHLATPESRGSPVAEFLIPLGDIPEEEARSVEEEVMPEAVTRENIMGMLRKSLQEHREVSFHSLLPPLADRSTVARSFSALLASASARTLHVEQEESYGPIMIARGPLYEEGDRGIAH